MKVARLIETEANDLLVNVKNNELSHAIIAAGNSLRWARFRKAGGVYWVPSYGAPKFRALLDDLEKNSSDRFFATIQPLFGDGDGRTVRNLSAAAENEIVSELEELTADLEKAEKDGMLTKALETRIVRCQELLIRADLYGEVLRDTAGKYKEIADDMRARFSKVLTPASADELFELEEG